MARPFLIWNASLVAALLLAGPTQAGDETVGHVMFVKGAVKILDATGRARLARQGDALRFGERIETGAESVGQVKLPDGSLVGLRPGTEMAIESVAGNANKARLLRLSRGAVRVINRDVSGQHPLLVETPTAEIRLVNADTEAIVVDSAEGARQGLPSGTYSRVIAGDGTLRTARGDLSLQRGQAGFAAGGDRPPASLSSLPETLQTAMLAGTRPGR
jgi:hypothetical protein